MIHSAAQFKRHMLLDQLTFYGSYHRDARNKAVHLVCVPLIAWSVLVWLWA